MGLFSQAKGVINSVPNFDHRPGVFETLRGDLERYFIDEGGFAARRVSPWLRLTIRTLFRTEVQAIIVYRYGNWAYHIALPEQRQLRLMMRFWRGIHLALHYILSKFWLSISGIFIPAPAEVGKGIFFPHPGPIYINAESVIGNNATIYPCVVVGGDHSKNGAPIIGDNVVLGAGCKVLGPIRLGNNVIVGANAVVISNIPNDSLAVGVPAVIKKRTWADKRSAESYETSTNDTVDDALLPPAA